ncbi:hypothetical protein VQL36_03725 [Chengkuizengella sp. SCS-71B]|uniref:hypothetical protein n=1 Tax=Chengkuizengella sp. SCS-71B TaxID=3115290 RepID=UPI0032C2326E
MILIMFGTFLSGYWLLIYDNSKQKLDTNDFIVKPTTPEQMREHTFSGQIIESTSDNIVIQNGDQKQTFYINEHTKVQVGVVSDRSLDMIILGANVSILAYNGVAKVIHVKY